MKYGDVALNDEEHRVIVRGKEIHLTPIEYQLLHYLMSNVNRPVSKDNLFHEVWGYDFTGGTNLVEVAMRRLREKVETKPSAPEYLLTVRGAGYKFVDPEKELT
jgi:DNA-binding response OmpR family regulator